ncbi:MAG: GatB/YqeY domain-containing protein [Candidatus Omnitrophica bacterium]|nr:GatB/YqeY domain-containing protein [Candidatus Omnitrophota bacterium]
MLEEKILADYKQAMKDRDTLKSSVLSFLRAEMMNLAIEKKKNSLNDSEVVAVIKKQIKQRQDSIESFKKGNRQDLVDKETKELEILNSYLPAQLSLEEINRIIEEVVIALGAKGLADMGRVMKEVMAKAGVSADGKIVSELVKQRLSSQN